MKISIAFVVCVLLFSGCSIGDNKNSGVEKVIACEQEFNKAEFGSYLSQFAKFDGNGLDESFFTLRKQFPNEKWCPEISQSLFSAYLPHSCGTDEKEYCYRPCYRIEMKNYHLLSMKRERYSYDDNILATYSKQGDIIDMVVLGVSEGGASAYKIEPVNENEITCIQYKFKDIESAYEGDCDVFVYKVTLDDNGIIGKNLTNEEKNIKGGSINY